MLVCKTGTPRVVTPTTASLWRGKATLTLQWNCVCLGWEITALHIVTSQWQSFLTHFSIFKLRALILLHNWISKWVKWVKFPRMMVGFFLLLNYALNIATYSRTPFNQGETKIHNQTLIQEHLKCHRKCCYIAIISHNHELPHSSCFSVRICTTTAPPSHQHILRLQF